MQSIDADAWIAPSAQLYGRVRIGSGSSVWPQCVIRAECQEVVIGQNTNLQDFVMIHVGYDHPTPLPGCIATRPRRSGSPNVVRPSPPYVVPRIENSDELLDIASSCPSQSAQPRGAKLPPNMMISPMNGSMVRFSPPRVRSSRERRSEWSFLERASGTMAPVRNETSRAEEN